MKCKTSLILTLFCAGTILYGQESTKNDKAQLSSNDERIDLIKGTEDWAKKIASEVFDESNSEGEKTAEFYISKQENDLLVNPEVPLKSNKEETSNNCKTLTKTCRSEKCVENTLIEILGKGDRSVVIKYQRKLISVQIQYTYQDCN